MMTLDDSGDITQMVLYNITIYVRSEQLSGQKTSQQCQRSMVRAHSRTLQAQLKILLLINGGVKYVLSTFQRRSMGCAGNSNGMMTRRTLPHPKPVPKTRTPKYGESLGRCNRPNTTSKGRHWLRCVLSGLPDFVVKHFLFIAFDFRPLLSVAISCPVWLVSDWFPHKLLAPPLYYWL